jgi:hypothetical protein
MPDDGLIEEVLPATPSQTQDAAELLLDQLAYWRGRAAARKLRCELLSIRLAAAEAVCRSVYPEWESDDGTRQAEWSVDKDALDAWHAIAGSD